MSPYPTAFRALALREFYCEPRLADEFRAARWLAWLGRTAVRPAARLAGAHFGIPALLIEITCQRIMSERMLIFPLRILSDLRAQLKSDTDNYQSCCRSALCYIVTQSHKSAFSVLRHAAAKNDEWGRHHHLYGLIHGIDGDYERALFELGKAISVEPYPDTRQRIAEALRVVEIARQYVSPWDSSSPVPSGILRSALPESVLFILELLEQSEEG